MLDCKESDTLPEKDRVYRFSQIPDMDLHALSTGVEASYVLTDSWFTQQLLIQSLAEQGIDVI